VSHRLRKTSPEIEVMILPALDVQNHIRDRSNELLNGDRNEEPISTTEFCKKPPPKKMQTMKERYRGNKIGLEGRIKN
jgi:hypothetical protein